MAAFTALVTLAASLALYPAPAPYSPVAAAAQPSAAQPAEAQPADATTSPVPSPIASPSGVTLFLDGTSGPPGTVVSIGATGFQTGGAPYSASITFDNGLIGTQTLANCTASLGGNGSGFGFGTQCTGNPVTVTIPLTATSGRHIITVSGGPRMQTASAVYTVTPPPSPTATATPTMTPSNTPTTTPSNTPTATDTITPTPTSTNVPTATSTNTPIVISTNTPTATSTATASPSSTSASTSISATTPTSTSASATTPTGAGAPSSTATTIVTLRPTRTAAPPRPTRTAAPQPSPTRTAVPRPTPTHTSAAPRRLLQQLRLVVLIGASHASDGDHTVVTLRTVPNAEVRIVMRYSRPQPGGSTFTLNGTASRYGFFRGVLTVRIAAKTRYIPLPRRLPPRVLRSLKRRPSLPQHLRGLIPLPKDVRLLRVPVLTAPLTRTVDVTVSTGRGRTRRASERIVALAQ